MRRLDLPILIASALLLSSCSPDQGSPAATQKVAAVTLQKKPGASVATLTLSPEAEQRIALATERVEEREIARTRVVAAIVERPKGDEITYRAPIACVVTLPGNGAGLAVGARIPAGSLLLSIETWPTHSDRLQAQKLRNDMELARAQAKGATAGAQARLEAADIVLQRTEELVARDAGSRRARDDARAEHVASETALAAARELERALDAARIDEDAANVRIEMSAPFDAEVLGLFVASGQAVESGAQLVQIARAGSRWLRVPVLAGDAAQVDRTAELRLRDARGRELATRARPIDAPVSGDANNQTIELWYALSGAEEPLAPGQPVDAVLPLLGRGPRVVIALEALVYDAQGNAWVYARTAPQTFERLHVELAEAGADSVVVARGVAVGAEVVVRGAMELWGVEFGAGK